MYLITYGQFNDVVRQENGRDVPGDIIAPPYELLSCPGPWQIAGLRLYEHLLKTGMQDWKPDPDFHRDPRRFRDRGTRRSLYKDDRGWSRGDIPLFRTSRNAYLPSRRRSSSYKT